MRKLFTLLTVAITVVACQKDPVAESQEKTPQRSLNVLTGICEPDTILIYGGQTILVGNLIVSNDGIDLFVKYEITNPDYAFTEAQLWVGTDPMLVPATNSGTPIPGQFPYKQTGLNNTVVEFVVPLADVVLGTTDYCGQLLYIYAHGATNLGETTWSFGVPFNSNRWGWYSNYTVCCSTSNPNPEYRSETAFAKFAKADGGYVFTTSKQSNPEKYPTLSLTMNRWGWAGNLSVGSYSSDIYAGAGLNNVLKGTKVGTLTAVVASGMVTITYSMLPNYSMEEVHLYVGDELPTTVAPGQYGHTVYFDPVVGSYSYTFSVLDSNGDGKFWVIAHAVANIPIVP